MAHSGFWRRFGAYVVDSLLSALLIMLIIFVVIYGAYIIAPSFSMKFLESFQAFKMSNPVLAFLGTDLLLFLSSPVVFAWFESARFQATPGKLLFKIRVVDLDYERVSFLRAFARQILKGGFFLILSYCLGLVTNAFKDGTLLSATALLAFVGVLITALAFLMVLFTAKKQNIYDLMTGCYVVRKPVALAPDAAEVS